MSFQEYNFFYRKSMEGVNCMILIIMVLIYGMRATKNLWEALKI